MPHAWADSIPVLDHFSEVADSSQYVPLPADWVICVSDVVNSTAAMEAGRYKAVNLAGAGTISAVSNALSGDLSLYVFGGDGAGFAVAPDQSHTAREALSRTAGWAERDLRLDLRVGMIRVSDIRTAGHDVRVAFWQASEHVRYTMFTGGGMEWATEQLKSGTIRLEASSPEEDPDLTGLSCQWGSIQPRNGKILSLIVKRGIAVEENRFAELLSQIIGILEGTGSLNPVPEEGPKAVLQPSALKLQAKLPNGNGLRATRQARVVVTAVFSWLIFKLGIRFGGFEPDRYRREMAANTDFRKYDDGLLMTVDCSTQTIEKLKVILSAAENAGQIRYGMHEQDEAMMTCVAPSVLSSDHVHFVDGAGGGYTAAAKHLSA